MSQIENAKPKIRGEVIVDRERCKGCYFCVEFCPTDVLVMSEDFNLKGYHFPEIAAADKCTGCGLCGAYCPDFAIFGHRI
jgi:2-oxoglutarate ferredoxin oxidoreductase subunit delta